MSLRTRLIVAFFLLSVVPLTVITVYSYRSSAAAIRTAAAEEGRQAAGEMSRRMETVTAGLSEQLDRLWDLPREPVQPDDEAADPRTAAALAQTLGTTASLLDRLEFVPGPPAPPGPPAALGSPAAPGTPVRADAPAPASPPSAPGVTAPAPPAPPAASTAAESRNAASRRNPRRQVDAAREAAREVRQRAAADEAVAQAAVEAARKQGVQADRIVVDIAGAMDEATRALREASARGDVPPWVHVMTQGVAQGLKLTAAATAQGLRIGQRELEQHLRTRGGDWVVRRGGRLGVPIQRQGRVVGTVNAELNRERVMAAVFGEARREQGEVPFAIDEDGRVFVPDPAKRSILTSLGATTSLASPRATSVENKDRWVVVKRRDESGMTFGFARPLGDSLDALRRTMMQNLMLGLLVIAIAAVGIIPISERMTRDLGTLATTAGQIANGNYAARVPVRSHDEIGRLSAAFNRMAEGVEAHQRLVVEQERLQRELDLCRRIQTEMLPHGALRLGFAEVKGVSIPAREVGGDFFNYFALENGDIAVLVGDVSGKGVGAALLMANVQATLRARLPLERDLAALVDAIDREVEERTPGGVYVTLFVGILEPAARRLRFVNAGHHPQFVLRRDGALERLPSAGLPVGLYAGHGYKEQEVSVGEGDLIFFYTDGTIETESESGDMFGVERLESLLEIAHGGDIDSVLSRVEAALRHFRGKAELFDDATMMALRLSEGPRVDAIAATPIA